MSLNGGDAAEQMVRILLSGVEMTVRLSGEGAKNLAALLYAWSQKQHDPAIQRQFGKTSMTKLLKSRQELHVFRMSKEEYKQFKGEARRFKLVYAALRNKKDPEALLDIVVRADEIPRVNHIFESIGYGSPFPERTTEKDRPEARPDPNGRASSASERNPPDEASKKKPPSRQDSSGARPRSMPSASAETRGERDRPASVKARLEFLRMQLAKDRGEAPPPARGRTPRAPRTPKKEK